MSEFDKEVEKLKQSIYQFLGVPAEYLKSSQKGICTSSWIQKDIGGDISDNVQTEEEDN